MGRTADKDNDGVYSPFLSSTRELRDGCGFMGSAKSNIDPSFAVVIRNIMIQVRTFCSTVSFFSFFFFFYLTSSISIPAPTLNTNPPLRLLPVLPVPVPPCACVPIPTFQHSNRARLTTSQRLALSASALSILIPAANLRTWTRRSARRVTVVSRGQEEGSSGR